MEVKAWIFLFLLSALGLCGVYLTDQRFKDIEKAIEELKKAVEKKEEDQ